MKDQGPLGAGHGGPPDDSNEEASPPGSGSAQITLPSITPRPAVDADTVVRGPARHRQHGSWSWRDSTSFHFWHRVQM